MSPPTIEPFKPPSAALLTTSWDDGHPLDMRVADMLARHGIAGTFYVPRQAPCGTMSAAQLGELATTFEIGAHTIGHEQLTSLSPAQSWREISGSKAWVEDRTGHGCRMFCPPRGCFSKGHLDMARRAGFLGLRTTELVSLDPPRQADGLWVMPTTVQAFAHRPLGYVRNAAKRAAPGNLWRYVRHGWAGSWPSLARRMLEQAPPTGCVFHLWGHSWELEEHRQWQRLDEVLRWMGSHAETGRTLTNGDVCKLAEAATGRSNGAAKV